MIGQLRKFSLLSLCGLWLCSQPATATPAAAIRLDKLTNGVDNHNPTSGEVPQVQPGGLVRWTYEVINTGSVPLGHISVTDDDPGVTVECPKTTLAPGEQINCTATARAVNLQTDTTVNKATGLCGERPNAPLYTNLGTASGQASTGQTVRDSSRSFYCNPLPPPAPEPPPPAPEPPPPAPEPPPPAPERPLVLSTPDGQTGLAALPANSGEIPNLSLTGPGAENADESLQGMSRDSADNLYVTGYAYNGTYNVYLLKYDRNGTLLWQQQFDSGNHDYSYGLAVDPFGAVYVAGYYLLGNTYRGLLLKYNPEGLLLWQREFSTGGLAVAFYGVGADATAVYAVGEAHNGITFDGLFVKYDPEGTIIWQGVRATGRDDTAYAIGLSHCAQQERAGLTVPVNCQPLVGGGDGAVARSGWLVALEPGSGLIQKDVTVAPTTPVAALAPGQDGTLYAAGTNANRDWEVMRLDRDFNVLWNAFFVGGGEDILRALALDIEGFLYAVGRTFNGANNDVLILAYNEAGTLLSQLQIDGGADERGYSALFDGSQRMFVAGMRRTPDGDTRFLMFRVLNGRGPQ